MHRFLLLVACWLLLVSNAGALLTPEPPTPLPLGQGEAVGFYCLGARHYDPQSGRFLSPDPLGHAASLSLYDYADGDPVNGIDPDGRLAKGVSSGWNGSVSANAPTSAAFNFGMVLGGTTRGGVEGLGIGIQNVSGYTSYSEHLEMFEGDRWAAANAAWNPAYMAMRGFTEAGTGMGLQPSNLGQNLTAGQRVWSTVDGVLGTAGTVGVGFSGAALTRSAGLTGPTLQSASPAARSPLALPAPRQVQATWGVNTYRHGGQMSAIEHINYRHSFNSGFSEVSRFAEGTSVRTIQSFVDDALRYGNVTPQGANGFRIDYDLGRTIGTNPTGDAASSIRVFVRDGNIQTAFPFAP